MNLRLKAKMLLGTMCSASLLGLANAPITSAVQPTIQGPVYGKACDMKLLDAISNGDLEKLNELIQNNPNLPNELHEGRPVLMLAIDRGCPEVVKWLLDNGANPNLADSNGRTCFAYACSCESSDVFATFLRYKDRIKVNVVDVNGHTPLSRAVVSASLAEDLSRVVDLLGMGADPNFADLSSPLCCAVSMGNINAMRVLLWNKAKPNLPGYATNVFEGVDEEKSSFALHRAVSLDNVTLAQSMVSHLQVFGANKDLPDEDGKTASDYDVNHILG